MKQYSFPLVEVDTHTHTIISGHAWSTLTENAVAARERGMKGLCLTEHGPALIGGAPEYTPHSQRMVPPVVEGIRIYKGIEANIINLNGDLDVDAGMVSKMEFVIASMHDVVLDPGTVEENTCAALTALKNDFVDVIGHPDRLWAEMDHERIVKESAAMGKIIEINNHSFRDVHAAENCRKIVRLCKKHDVRITVATDAHIAYNVGYFPKVMPVLEEEKFPEELVVNRNIRFVLCCSNAKSKRCSTNNCK